jgi:hypothetical protein
MNLVSYFVRLLVAHKSLKNIKLLILIYTTLIENAAKMVDIRQKFDCLTLKIP